MPPRANGDASAEASPVELARSLLALVESYLARQMGADGLAMTVARRTAPAWASNTRPTPFTQTGLHSPLPATQGPEKPALTFTKTG